MKHTTMILAALAACCALGSCRTDSPETQVSGLHGVLVLNNGNWGANDASVSLFDTDTKTVTGNVFYSVNRQRLGDLGQDIVRCGDELYIALNGSKLVFVTDLELKLKAQVEAYNGESKLQPRRLAAAEGKVYVTYYEGFLGEIDAATHTVRTVPVGNNPEGVALAAGKLYVANSGGLLYESGYDTTLSVVDAATLTETARLTVNCNPQCVVANASGSRVYVNSWGNYDDILPKLQSVETATLSVTDEDYTDVKGIAMGRGDTLIVVTGGYDADWQISGTLWKHDAARDVKAGRFSETAVTPYYSVSADAASGQVFVGTSDYATDGDVWLFDARGRLSATFDAQGMNPQKCLLLD